MLVDGHLDMDWGCNTLQIGKREYSLPIDGSEVCLLTIIHPARARFGIAASGRVDLN
jgi:hypothetical protein